MDSVTVLSLIKIKLQQPISPTRIVLIIVFIRIVLVKGSS